MPAQYLKICLKKLSKIELNNCYTKERCTSLQIQIEKIFKMSNEILQKFELNLLEKFLLKIFLNKTISYDQIMESHIINFKKFPTRKSLNFMQNLHKNTSINLTHSLSCVASRQAACILYANPQLLKNAALVGSNSFTKNSHIHVVDTNFPFDFKSCAA